MLSGLNSPQKQAVRHTDSPLLVLAGAGSGKTTVITRKICWLMEKCAVPPENIFAVTFTNKAAKEMRARITSRTGNDKNKTKASEAVTICTFHALGLKIISSHQAEFNLRKGFNIIDGEDSRTIIKNLLPLAQGSDKQIVYGVHQCISNWKGSLIDPGQALTEHANNPDALLAAKIFPDYIKTLQAYNVLDFDDLIYLP
ncbi:MAG: UvrD-helicase domain-containing protein, partial [Acidiferrobacterales bacterium]